MAATLRSLTFALLLLSCFPGAALAQLVTKGSGSEAVRLSSQTVTATLEGGLATVHIHQVFRYEGSGSVEAVYTFPLPEDASMTGLTLTAGGQRMEGVLTERKKAREIYRDIVRSQRDPALLEKIGEGRFRLSIFPVVPNADTVIDLEYVQRVPLYQGAFQLTLPLGGDTAAGANTTANVEVRAYRRLGDITASESGTQVIRQGISRATVSYERGSGATGPAPEGLTITAHLGIGDPSFEVETYRTATGETYFVAVYSPGTPREKDLLPRDVILVLDTSGSMEGIKLERAQMAAHWLVDQLGERDRVNIVRFSSDVSSALPGLQTATPETRALLHSTIDGLVAEGSTALGDVLSHVAAVSTMAGRSRSVVLLTDGRPTIGEVDPVRLITTAFGIGKAGLRLHTFGVGSDLDAGLLHGAALATGGTSEVFDNPLEIESRLQRFLSRTSAPALKNLRLTADGVQIRGTFPRVIPDAYLGEQIVLTGRIDGDGVADFHLDGEGPEGPRRISRTPSILSEPEGRPIVALQYATLKLEELKDAIRLQGELSAAMYEVTRKYWNLVDAGRYSTQGEIQEEMIRTSLVHGVQCAYTSFLALEAADRGRLNGENEETEEEPIIEEFEVSDHNETDTNEDFGSANSPFDSNNTNAVLGIGGGAFHPRFKSRPNTQISPGAEKDARIEAALRSLKEAAASTDTVPSLRADALSLLAYLGNGHTLTGGPHRDETMRLVKSLRNRRDGTTRQFVDAAEPGANPEDPVLDHLLASIGMCEAYYFSRSILVRATAQQSLSFVETAMTDGAGLSDWSEAALLAALELGETARAAGLRWRWTELFEGEIQRRAQTGATSILLMAAQLQTVQPSPARDELAAKLAAAAVDRLPLVLSSGARPKAAADTVSAHELRWIADALHAVGGPSWTILARRLEQSIPDPSIGLGGWDRETLAAWALAMEAHFRLRRPHR